MAEVQFKTIFSLYTRLARKIRGGWDPGVTKEIFQQRRAWPTVSETDRSRIWAEVSAWMWQQGHCW